jgi:hypothetical protein
VTGLDALPCATLVDAVAFLRGERRLVPAVPPEAADDLLGPVADLSEVRGQPLLAGRSSWRPRAGTTCC